MIKAYLIEEDQYLKLRRLSAQMHGGSDRERDYGARLLYVLDCIEDFDVDVDRSTLVSSTAPAPGCETESTQKTSAPALPINPMPVVEFKRPEDTEGGTCD